MILNNTATNVAGGGIALMAASSIELWTTEVQYNNAPRGGGAIIDGGSTLKDFQNTWFANTANTEGGGIAFWSGTLAMSLT
eukprot:2267071-Rhodomonas_salina.1